MVGGGLEVQLTKALWHSECVNSMLAEFTAPKQVGETCYANACAAAIYHANCRILGRRNLSFEQLREKMISRFGYYGAYLENVLSEATFWNLGGRLHYQEVNEAQARETLSRRRHPLVAMFALTNKQWGRFSEFYRHFPYSSMPEAWIAGTGGELHFATGNVASGAAQDISGHAVLATSVDEQGNLVLLNSWGTDFANNGSFKIKSGAVLNLRFFHVCFLESDLSDHERESYRLTINYIYAVQKCARGKNPFRPAITRGFDGRYHEDSYSKHTVVNELLEAAGCPSLSDSLDIPNAVDAEQAWY